MLFSSITFIFYFLPIILLLYFIVPAKFKNTVLLCGSLFFYAWGEPRYLFLMISIIILGYVTGLLIEKTTNKATKKALVAFIVCASIGILVYYKYSDFFISSVNNLTKLNIPLLNVALPIGISFYVFQMLSYCIDIYRGQVKAQRNIIKLATFISMFPQLIAGPIVRYKDIEASLSKRNYSVKNISDGITRFTMGLGKKVLIANVLGQLVANYKACQTPTVLYVWLYAFAASLQIYFDFSGYSDMAIGLGKILGFEFPENFNYPYISRSATEFWRRWHMTLGSWFRDYLYIPIGGNRVSKPRYYFNIFIVWMTTGLWHGASWNFILWGLYFAIFLIIEKSFLLKFLEKYKILSHIYLIVIVIVSFLIFDSSDFNTIIINLKYMLGIGDISLYSNESIFMLIDYAGILFISILAAIGIPKAIIMKLKNNAKSSKVISVLEVLFVTLVLVISTAFLVNGSFNPFLYFRF